MRRKVVLDYHPKLQCEYNEPNMKKSLRLFLRLVSPLPALIFRVWLFQTKSIFPTVYGMKGFSLLNKGYRIKYM